MTGSREAWRSSQSWKLGIFLAENPSEEKERSIRYGPEKTSRGGVTRLDCVRGEVTGEGLKD